MRASRSGAFVPTWVRELIAPYRTHAIVALALGLAAICCAALLMFTSGYLISKTAQATTTLFMVMVPVALVQLFGLGRPIARYFERLISHDFVFRITSNVRLKLFCALEERATVPGALRETGEYVEYLSEDIGHLQNLYLRVAFPTAIAWALYVLAAVFCGFLSFVLAGAVLVCGTLAAILLPIATFLAAKPLQERARLAKSAEFTQLTDDILGASDWAIAGRGAEARSLHEQQGSRSRTADASVRRLVRCMELASSLALGIGVCMVVAISGETLQGDPQTANLIAAFTLGFFPLIEAFALLPSAFAETVVHENALSRLDAVISAQSAPPSADERETNRPHDRAIVLRDVSYRYPSATRPAVHDVNIDIPARLKLAILGPSGSGKTTLAALLRGVLHPDTGYVSVDGRRYVDMPTTHEGLVGYIPQTPYLFDQTLRENLALAKPDATDAELVATLQKVGLHKKYQTLPKGLDTPIGETGMGLSGGEAHRVALARALLADYPIVLLDEPFTALDPITEQQLLETLFDAFADKTLIVITHHLAGIERFDRIVFIENGAIELDGPPHELARNEPTFYQLLAFDRGDL